MGSKEEDVPSAPVEQTRFVEDMNESELATAVRILHLLYLFSSISVNIYRFLYRYGSTLKCVYVDVMAPMTFLKTRILLFILKNLHIHISYYFYSMYIYS